MQEELDASNSSPEASSNTLYKIAREAMTQYVQVY